MKVIILAGGYGKRLYPITKNFPKPLLDVKGKPIIEHLIVKLKNIALVKDIYVVSNDRFYNTYKKWKQKKGFSFVKLINDGTRTPDTRLGAIGDIQYAITKKRIQEDVLVLGGDNFFEFGLLEFIIFSQTKSPSCSIGVYNVHSKLKAKRFGIVKLNKDKRVIAFKEKSKRPDTTLISPCIYYFTKSKLNLIKKYLREKNNPDMSGDFIRWLQERDHVYGFIFHGRWIDIGNLAAYDYAKKHF